MPDQQFAATSTSSATCEKRVGKGRAEAVKLGNLIARQGVIIAVLHGPLDLHLVPQGVKYSGGAASNRGVCWPRKRKYNGPDMPQSFIR
jgi:hypothetical protein